MVEAGHDVYFASNRGTEYATGHTTLDFKAADESAYWNFSWGDFPADILASAEAMYNNAKLTNGSAAAVKGYYIGYSQGTIQMLAALATIENDLD